MAETAYCRSENYDPQDPRCARLILSGKIKRIKTGTAEEDFAKEALFSRHPAMSTWPAGKTNCNNQIDQLLSAIFFHQSIKHTKLLFFSLLDHEWFFAKLKIGQIVLLDQFGGPKYIDVQEYLNVEPPTRT